MATPQPAGPDAAGIHQFVPMLHADDAVGGHTVAVQQALLRHRIASNVYVELEDPDTRHLTKLVDRYADDARPGDVLVYQFATASAIAGLLLARPETLVVNYHNVTPAELLGSWDNPLARHQDRARAELAALGRRAALGVAVSEVNRTDLVAAGFATTALVPPCVHLDAPASGPLRPPRRRGARWLAVGRLAPNKAIEDAIAALLVYRLDHDPEATLTVVGKPAVAPYAAALRRFAADIGLHDAVQFAGRLSSSELSRAYDDADVLVVTSEHEGFCFPIVEAMSHRLPVVAFRQGAVPEVAGEAAALVDDKDPTTISTAVHRLQTDEGWRHALIEAGERRLDELDLAGAAAVMADLLVAVRDRSAAPAAAHVQTTVGR